MDTKDMYYRNRQIVKDVLNGNSLSGVAKEHLVSASRIKVITQELSNRALIGITFVNDSRRTITELRKHKDIIFKMLLIKEN